MSEPFCKRSSRWMDREFATTLCIVAALVSVNVTLPAHAVTFDTANLSSTTYSTTTSASASLPTSSAIAALATGLQFEAHDFVRVCPTDTPPSVVEIRDANPNVDRAHHDDMKDLLRDSVARPNTTVLLGPNVVLDFAGEAPIEFGPCVTLASINAFGTLPVSPGTSWQSARSPSSLGPLIKFGPHRASGNQALFLVNCDANSGKPPADNVRISGFRLYGPSFGQQETDDFGIRIQRCLNAEISNMEVAGWGGAAISIVDQGDADHQPIDGAGQQQPDNRPGERIGPTGRTRVFGNHIHHNQHHTGYFGGHATGYGVDVSHGAWTEIFENTFDFNRHAIAASGDTGGYQAQRNLVLKGGGVEYDHFGVTYYTHQFDIHGSVGGYDGNAGVSFDFSQNAFQYFPSNPIGVENHAITIRGRPLVQAAIHDNVFVHPGLESDWGEDAIKVRDLQDIADGKIVIGPNNTIDQDTYGEYGVCDFDGDGVDDLFLATGQSWWFTSFGEFQWSYLNARTQRLSAIRLGYFDADKRCDVLTESNGKWVISSGGTSAWKSLGSFGAPLSEVTFGRFDPSVRDHRPGVTRQTTHAFWRTASGQWRVTPLTSPAWHDAASSSFPMNQLRFGDFTGDGVTDVLAVQGGRWSISNAGHGAWQRLNTNLADDVSSLYIADLNHNNIDDLIKLQVSVLPNSPPEVFKTVNCTWWVSDDGRGVWRELKRYSLVTAVYDRSPPAFAGRFGAAPGGGVMLVDYNRFGRFYSEAEIATGVSPDWMSLFAY